MAHGGVRPAAAAALKRCWADPEYRARMIERIRAGMARRWDDPEYRARQIKSIARAKERRNEAIRRAWADPAVRKRAGEAISRGWARRQGCTDAVAEVDARMEHEHHRKCRPGRYKHIPTPHSEARRKAQIIPCMCCREDFRSEGAHNRMCPKCRRISVSPFEPD